MAKVQSPLLGYNTNVRHKGRVFHIQTEDSGVQRPHVITHLFADGGRIIKSNKTSYADTVDAPDLAVRVKKIMQDQHKAMFIALRDGRYDQIIDPTGEGTIAEGSADFAKVTVDPRSLEARPGPLFTTSSASLPAFDDARMSVAPDVAGAAPPASGSASATASLGIDADRPSMPGAAHYGIVRTPDSLGAFRARADRIGTPTGGIMSEKSLDEVILAFLADELGE